MASFGILLSLGLLMYFAYKGINVLFLAPVLALVAVVFQGDFPILASYTQIFMPALGNYMMLYFPIFMLGAVFGKLLADSGAAQIIANVIARAIGPRHAILAVVLSCAALTYGGVSLFVVAFCMYPIAQSLFFQAQTPKRLIPGAIALGSFTFTMTAFPGTPAIQNAIPMPYFGTTTYAAPGLGIIGSIIMFGLGMWWLNRRAATAKANGESYLPLGQNENVNVSMPMTTQRDTLIAFVPLVTVIACNLLATKYIIPNLDAGYLSQPIFGSTTLEKVKGIWVLSSSVALGIAVAFIVFRKRLNDPIKSLNEGTFGSMLPIFNTASEVGYGKVIASLPAFALIKGDLLGFFPQYPTFSIAVAVNGLAGITGSAGGGLSIALEALGKSYMELAQAQGLNPEVLHRVASMSSGGLDTLPHNGAVITLLAICGLNHKTSYLDILMVSCVFTVFATFVVVALSIPFGSF